MTTARQRTLWLVMGAVVGVAITLAVVAVRARRDRSAGRAGDASATAPAQPGAPPVIALDRIARAQEIARLRARISELEATAPGPGDIVFREPTTEHGMSTSDEWWQKMPRNATWDSARERLVVDRLARNLGVRLDPSRVSCRTRCCRVRVSEEVYDAKGDDIHSSVGLGFEPPDGYGTSTAPDGNIQITTCWSTAPHRPLPDRAAERDALLARTADALQRCARGIAHPEMLRLVFHLDENGAIEKVDSNKAQLGDAAASCAETVILEAAAFAPAPMSTTVPMDVRLGS